MRYHLRVFIAARATELTALFFVTIIKNLKRHAMRIDPFMKISYLDGNQENSKLEILKEM